MNSLPTLKSSISLQAGESEDQKLPFTRSGPFVHLPQYRLLYLVAALRVLRHPPPLPLESPPLVVNWTSASKRFTLLWRGSGMIEKAEVKNIRFDCMRSWLTSEIVMLDWTLIPCSISDISPIKAQKYRLGSELSELSFYTRHSHVKSANKFRILAMTRERLMHESTGRSLFQVPKGEGLHRYGTTTMELPPLPRETCLALSSLSFKGHV